MNRNSGRPKKVVVIGGGTGTFVVLSGLKDKPVELTAIISMMDSGGSNRILRDEFGLLPTSDIRQCLVALAEDQGDQEILRQLFTYRFYQGTGIAGMTFGNLFMAALADIYKSQIKALEVVQCLLHTKGKILPVTLDDVHLVARYADGRQVLGEHEIDQPKHDGCLRIVEIETIPQAKVYPVAKKAILEADFIILGPGDLFTSLIPNLVVEGVASAIKKTKAQKIFVMNLMTRYGQTFGFTAQDHISEIEKFLGPGVLDGVLVNSDGRIPAAILKRYQEENSEPVKDDLRSGRYRVIRADLVSPFEVAKVRGDQIKRSLLRHDPNKLASALVKFFIE